jgi:hypothetical protein
LASEGNRVACNWVISVAPEGSKTLSESMAYPQSTIALANTGLRPVL